MSYKTELHDICRKICNCKGYAILNKFANNKKVSSSDKKSYGPILNAYNNEVKIVDAYDQNRKDTFNSLIDWYENNIKVNIEGIKVYDNDRSSFYLSFYTDTLESFFIKRGENIKQTSTDNKIKLLAEYKYGTDNRGNYGVYCWILVNKINGKLSLAQQDLIKVLGKSVSTGGSTELLTVLDNEDFGEPLLNINSKLTVALNNSKTEILKIEAKLK